MAVSGYDPFGEEFQADPFTVYRWMRDEEPVYYSEKWNWWALSRWDDVRAAALDPDSFLSYEGIDLDATATDQAGPGFLPNIDNPRHDEVRGVVQPPLVPRRVNAYEGMVRNVVVRLVDGFRDRGAVDIAQELAWPMPNEVFFDVFGLPRTDEEGRDNLQRWIHELKDRNPGEWDLTPVARAATDGINAYFVKLLNERRRDPRPDLISHIVGATIGGTPFADAEITPDSEVMGLMRVLFLGGVESTAGLTASAFKLLAEHPDQRSLLLADPLLIPAAVEEAVRWSTPLQHAGRTTSREVTLHGVTIPAGGRVVLVYGSANRDERQFEDPDDFRIDRGTFRHLGFGEGLHGCLGAPLARLELRVALQEALPVLGEYELAGDAIRYRTTPNMYVWNNLPIRYSPAAVPA
jgi:cytochrome P450